MLVNANEAYKQYSFFFHYLIREKVRKELILDLGIFAILKGFRYKAVS